MHPYLCTCVYACESRCASPQSGSGMACQQNCPVELHEELIALSPNAISTDSPHFKHYMKQNFIYLSIYLVTSYRSFFIQVLPDVYFNNFSNFVPLHLNFFCVHTNSFIIKKSTIINIQYRKPHNKTLYAFDCENFYTPLTESLQKLPAH